MTLSLQAKSLPHALLIVLCDPKQKVIILIPTHRKWLLIKENALQPINADTS